MHSNRFYVYAWFNKETNEPFYVGKGSRDRYKSVKSKNSGRSKELLSYVKTHEWYPKIVIEDLLEDDAFEGEKLVIKTYRNAGYALLNKCDGGRGVTGREITDEYRLKYHYMCLGENNPNYGNRWSEEQRNHLSKVRKEKQIAKYGNNPRAKSVMCVETGRIFSCQQEASDWLGLKSMASINRALKNKCFTAKGYHFAAGSDIEELNTEDKRNKYLLNLSTEKGRII